MHIKSIAWDSYKFDADLDPGSALEKMDPDPGYDSVKPKGNELRP